MVGLPARGKTYISRKLSRYLTWTGYNCQVFNIGSYRRKLFGAEKSNEFFDPYNAQGVEQRRQCAVAALEDMVKYFISGGHAAVYDGTNSTSKRRNMIMEYLQSEGEKNGMNIEVVWIESICNDEEIVQANVKETKLTSPDYIGLSAITAEEDFMQRIKQYEKSYETLPTEADYPYVKIVDVGRQVTTNRIYGYLMGKITHFLMNLRPNKCPIYITRHGESQHNLRGLIGGDSELSANGRAYGQALATFLHSEQFHEDNANELTVWTSTLRRTIETASYLSMPTTQWRALIEIQVGICEDMTYAEVEERYPAEWAARKRDKLRYRYPQGESYMDVVQRVEPVIFELERMQAPVLLIVHRAVARCLLSYFADYDQHDIPHLEVPLHTLLKLEPKAYGCDIQTHRMEVPSVEDEGPHVQTSS